MDLKDEFIQIIKRYSELSLMDTENETKKYIQEAFNASLSEVFITDTQEPSKQEQSKMDVFIFLKKEKI